MSKKIFVVTALIVLVISLSGCVGEARLSGNVLIKPQPVNASQPLCGLVIRDVNLNNYYMENALRRELSIAGARFGPSGAVLNGNVKIVKSGRYPFCYATMEVNVGSFGFARLYSAVGVRVDCIRGAAIIYPRDYQQTAQLIVQDFIWQVNH